MKMIPNYLLYFSNRIIYIYLSFFIGQSMKTVLVSLLGTTLDKGLAIKRWNHWRPSVSICQHEDLLINEYHLIFPESFLDLARVVVRDIGFVSPETKVIKHPLNFNDPWDFEEVYSGLHNFVKQLEIDPEENEYLFHITTGTHVAQICIFLLTESHFYPGKLLQTGPSKDSNAGVFEIIDLDLSRYDKLASRFEQELKDDISFLKSGIETRNKAFNKLIERIELVALRSPESMLICGPTGSGKSHLAKRIFELKKLHSHISGSFVEINCATLRGDAAMSTLFGHKKGAFTGALTDRPGLLKKADKGMVFLDEVGELGSDEQAMLLHAIEEKKFISVGSDNESYSDFQLICGTNKNLNKAVQEGSFREDLLARINLWTFELPGLNLRPEDIEPNIKYELNRFAEKTGSFINFNKEAHEKFLKFSISDEALWKANFRDLNGAIFRMCTLAIGGRINSAIVDEEIVRLKEKWYEPTQKINELLNILPEFDWEKIDLFDQIQLQNVVKVCMESNSLSAAGRKLYSVSRLSKANPNDSDRLKKYINKFGITWKDIEKEKGDHF